MKRRSRTVVALGIAMCAPAALPAQAQPSHGFTAGVRGALAFPKVSLGRDSLYQGDVQVSWQLEAGFRVAGRLTLGLETAFNRTPKFAGDCPTKCSPSPDYSAFSAKINWAPGGAHSHHASVLLSAGAGLYRVRGDDGSARSDEVGFHAGGELPLIRFKRHFWIAASLRGDVVPGVPASGLYVISLGLGIRHWGL